MPTPAYGSTTMRDDVERRGRPARRSRRSRATGRGASLSFQVVWFGRVRQHEAEDDLERQEQVGGDARRAGGEPDPELGLALGGRRQDLVRRRRRCRAPTSGQEDDEGATAERACGRSVRAVTGLPGVVLLPPRYEAKDRRKGFSLRPRPSGGLPAVESGRQGRRSHQRRAATIWSMSQRISPRTCRAARRRGCRVQVARPPSRRSRPRSSARGRR